MNNWERSLREERYQHQYQQQSKVSSFSSSLLDAMYRSIDESRYKDTEITAMKMKKQRNSNLERNNGLEAGQSLRKAIMFEKWMENDENRSLIRGYSRIYNSTSSSSDSSCGGVFSSSETESVHRESSKSISFTIEKGPKQVGYDYSAKSEPTPERRLLMRTTSKAQKIYGDLKKVKQPISPGRRITSFLNSLFNSLNVKHAKRESMDELNTLQKSRSAKDHATTCSLSSSFSRSCLSKPPPSSRPELNSNDNGRLKSKRTVRFYPVSAIVDEYSSPCATKCVYKDDPSLMPTPTVRKIAEITVLKKEANNTNEYHLREFDDEDLDEDEADGMSCTSSDLFELDNIGEVGVGSAYEEDLPVYGTTSLKKNHAIVNGFIL